MKSTSEGKFRSRVAANEQVLPQFGYFAFGHAGTAADA